MNQPTPLRTLDDLSKLSAEQLIRKATENIDDSIEFYSVYMVGAYQKLRGDKMRNASRAEQVHRFNSLRQELMPVRWMPQALRVMLGLRRQIRGNHHVYLVLLENHEDTTERYSIYVGETAFHPENRFEKHLEGGRTASSHVTKFGKQLLPQLYRHLNKLSVDEARGQGQFADMGMERKMRDVLLSKEIPVFGGRANMGDYF